MVGVSRVYSQQVTYQHGDVTQVWTRLSTPTAASVEDKTKAQADNSNPALQAKKRKGKHQPHTNPLTAADEGGEVIDWDKLITSISQKQQQSKHSLEMARDDFLQRLPSEDTNYYNFGGGNDMQLPDDLHLMTNGGGGFSSNLDTTSFDQGMSLLSKLRSSSLQGGTDPTMGFEQHPFLLANNGAEEEIQQVPKRRRSSTSLSTCSTDISNFDDQIVLSRTEMFLATPQPTTATGDENQLHQEESERKNNLGQKEGKEGLEEDEGEDDDGEGDDAVTTGRGRRHKMTIADAEAFLDAPLLLNSNCKKRII